MGKNTKLVYSTNPEAMREQESEPTGKELPLENQTAKIRLDRKGRKGKSMTIIEGLQVNPQHLNDIARELKQHLGTGGTAKQGVIEIQGDRRDQVEAKLAAMGVKTKRVGG